MAKFKERELIKLPEYEFSIEGSLDKIRKITSILKQFPLEKITLSVIGYVCDAVPENLHVLRIDYDDRNVVCMRPKYHVLDDVIVDDDKDNVNVKECEVYKRIEFTDTKYSLEIFYNASLKDKL